MTTTTSTVLTHRVIDATPSLRDPWDTYGHVYCVCPNGLRVLLLYLRPDCAQADDPGSHNCYDPAAGYAVLFFKAWQFAVQKTLFDSGRPVRVELDDAHPWGARVFTPEPLLAPTNEPVPDLAAWLHRHADVRAALKWRRAELGETAFATFDDWPAGMQHDFLAAFAAAWNHLPSGLADPPPNLADYATTRKLVFSPNDAWRFFCAHTAHSLALEIGSRVPWSIARYDASDLEQILHGGSLFWWDAGLHGYELLLEVAPMPPERTWAFFRNNALVAGDRVGSIGRVLDWCRNHLGHAGDGSALENAPQLVSNIIDGTLDARYPEYGVRHWTLGCGFTAAFLKSLLRSANVVAEKVFRGGHMSVHFTTDDLYLSHGDDPYSGETQCTPAFDAKLLLIDNATFTSWFGASVSQSTAEANVGRRTCELSVEYLSDYVLNLYYQDKAAGTAARDGRLYRELERYYPDFSDLYPDLWHRMNAKLARLGSVEWPACGTYDADLLMAARAALAVPLVQNLTPDTLEPNDDLESATRVTLEVADTDRFKVRKDEAHYTLSFSGAGDIDAFRIEYTCPHRCGPGS